MTDEEAYEADEYLFSKGWRTNHAMRYVDPVCMDSHNIDVALSIQKERDEIKG